MKGIERTYLKQTKGVKAERRQGRTAKKIKPGTLYHSI